MCKFAQLYACHELFLKLQSKNFTKSVMKIYVQVYIDHVYLQGPMGYEGIFRKACEVTLRVMRTQMDPLMRYESINMLQKYQFAKVNNEK